MRQMPQIGDDAMQREHWKCINAFGLIKESVIGDELIKSSPITALKHVSHLVSLEFLLIAYNLTIRPRYNLIARFLQ